MNVATFRPPVAASTGLLSTVVGAPEWSSAAALARQLSVLSEAGFDHLDISDIWFDVPGIDAVQIELLTSAIRSSGLSVVGASVVGVTVDDPKAVASAGERLTRGIRVAAALGAPTVSVGLHNAPSRSAPRTPDPQYPWMAMGGPPESRDEHFVAAGRILRTAAGVAEGEGVTLSLEMNEMSLLSSGRNCLRVIELADRPDIGVNPDLGSLVRVPWPLSESWQETLELVTPHVNYFHVKNCHRIPLENGRYATTPAPFAEGVIDYRWCLSLLGLAGVSPAIVVEHYGGDVLWFAEDARRYLEGVLDWRTRRFGAERAWSASPVRPEDEKE